jgi:hypothetical protein
MDKSRKEAESAKVEKEKSVEESKAQLEVRQPISAHCDCIGESSRLVFVWALCRNYQKGTPRNWKASSRRFSSRSLGQRRTQRAKLVQSIPPT